MPGTGPLNRPQRLFYYLAALSALSREYGLVIAGDPKLEWRDGAQGAYALNPNNDGPEFGWREAK